MGRLCSVCTHPERRAIDVALIEHSLPYRAIADAYRLSTPAVKRHRNEHLRERLERAQMLDAQALAARMAKLDGHVDRILEQSEHTQDDRLGLMAIAEGRRNIETLMRLLIVHAAEQHDQPYTVDADGQPRPDPIPMDATRIRTVLQMLIESGAALPSPEQRAAEQEEHQRANTESDDTDRGYHTVPAV